MKKFSQLVIMPFIKPHPIHPDSYIVWMTREGNSGLNKIVYLWFYRCSFHKHTGNTDLHQISHKHKGLTCHQISATTYNGHIYPYKSQIFNMPTMNPDRNIHRLVNSRMCDSCLQKRIKSIPSISYLQLNLSTLTVCCPELLIMQLISL